VFCICICLISCTESETYAHVGLRDGGPVFRAPFCTTFAPVYGCYWPTSCYFVECVCPWVLRSPTSPFAYFRVTQRCSLCRSVLVHSCHVDYSRCCTWNNHVKWVPVTSAWRVLRGTNSNIEGSCEYIEQAVADSRQVVILILGVERGVNNSSP